MDLGWCVSCDGFGVGEEDVMCVSCDGFGVCQEDVVWQKAVAIFFLDLLGMLKSQIWSLYI